MNGTIEKAMIMTISYSSGPLGGFSEPSRGGGPRSIFFVLTYVVALVMWNQELLQNQKIFIRCRDMRSQSGDIRTRFRVFSLKGVVRNPVLNNSQEADFCFFCQFFGP